MYGDGFGSDYTFNVASGTALKDKAKVAALRDYLTRLNRATVWADTHQDAWARTWAREIGLPLPVARVAAGRRVTRPVPIDTAVVDGEQALADAFSGAGLIPGHVKIADFTDQRFNDTVSGGSS